MIGHQWSVVVSLPAAVGHLTVDGTQSVNVAY